MTPVSSRRGGGFVVGSRFFFVVGLALVGLELATGAGTAALVRLQEGFTEYQATGTTSHVSTLRFRFGLGAFAIALLLGLSFVAREVMIRRLADLRCPQCGKETKRVRRKSIHRIVTPILGQNISRRRCRECGWAGLVKDH